jgi:hypothetical protein
MDFELLSEPVRYLSASHQSWLHQTFCFCPNWLRIGLARWLIQLDKLVASNAREDLLCL